MTRLSRKAMLLCCSAMPAWAVAPAFAQDEGTAAVEQNEDVVVVSGIRSAIEQSLETKRESTSIVEAISAEDIGKLPDLSIADSLARLPGVTAQRVRGRAQQISIRGLGPDFSIALLNGREQVSAGNNRGIEFDQFPSELISQGIVYKTPDATLAATGIAGAVDLRTIRPLNFSGRQFNVSARYVVNDFEELNPDFDRNGYRLFGSYIDQFADGTIGVSLAATVQSNPTQFTSRELKTNQFQVATDDATGLVYPSDNPRSGAVSREFERTSVAGTLQWEPNERFDATFDAFYTETEDSGIFRGVETPLASWAGVTPGTFSGEGPFAEVGSYLNTPQVLRTDTEGNEAEIFSFGINAGYDVTERLSLMADFSRSTLDRTDRDYESYAGLGAGIFGDPAFTDTTSIIFDDDGDYRISSPRDYTDPDEVLLTDPGGWGQVGFFREPLVEDELNQLRLQADYGFEETFVSNFRVGYLRTTREKTFDNNGTFLRAGTGFTDGSLAIPADAIIGATNSDTINLDIIAYDPSSFLTDGTYTLEKAVDDVEWVVEEDIDTFYVQADIETLVADMPLRGNVGFQYVETTQESTGTLSGQGLQTIEDSYSDFLPSMNLALEIMDDTFLRFAAAKTVTRARLDQLAANQNISFSTDSCVDTNADQVPDTLVEFDPPQLTCFSLGGGNPTLQPFESTSFDVSFEKYLSNASNIAIAVFHKELSDWVIDRSVLVDASSQIRDFGAGAFLDANPQTSLAVLSGPVNLAEGSITGIELTTNLALGDVYDPLDGFGAFASYTYADNSLEFDGDEITIPGYSDTVWSGNVYYDKNGFRARLSARHRSEFLSEVLQFDASLAGAEAREETVLDAQIGYEFDRGPLEGFTFLVEAFNLTNEPFVTQNDIFGTDGAVIGNFPSRFEEYGTTYNFVILKEF